MREYFLDIDNHRIVDSDNNASSRKDYPQFTLGETDSFVLKLLKLGEDFDLTTGDWFTWSCDTDKVETTGVAIRTDSGITFSGNEVTIPFETSTTRFESIISSGVEVLGFGELKIFHNAETDPYLIVQHQLVLRPPVDWTNIDPEELPDEYYTAAEVDALLGAYYKHYLYYGAGSLVPAATNGAIPGGIETGTNDINVDILKFKGVDNNTIAWFKFPIEKSSNVDTFKVKIEWLAGAGASPDDYIKFHVSSVVVDDDDTFDEATGTAVDIVDQVLDDSKLHITSASSAITPAGTAAEGKLLLVKIERDYDYAGAGSAMSEEVWLLGVRLEYNFKFVSSGW